MALLATTSLCLATAAFAGGPSAPVVASACNLQSGNLVYGGELAYLYCEPERASKPTYFFSGMIDVKARVGYKF